MSLNGEGVSGNETFGIKICAACNGNVCIAVLDINPYELEEGVSRVNTVTE